jgi:mannose-6-phosphate isomerase-like protein (cupin superfamily)
MHITKTDIPVRIDAPGAVARQQTDFGAAFGVMGAEYFSMAKGADLAPLLEGLRGNLCRSPHWGYVIDGAVTVTYEDSSTEVCERGDLFFWPAGHSVRVDEDADLVLFSPQSDHTPVIDHIKTKLGV